MKHRELVWTGCAGVAALLAGSVLAGETPESTIFGILKVESTRANTLVSVPWAGASLAAKETPVAVADLVKTANLTAGDRLMAYDAANGRYLCWLLQADAEGLLAWTPVATVAAGGVTVAPGEAEAKLIRGGALWVVRQDPVDAAGNARPFYLQGQYASAAARVEVAGGSAEAPAYTLLGNPTFAGAAVNALDWAGKPAAGDQLSIPDGAVPRVLNWDAGKGEWYRMVPRVVNGRVKQVRETADRLPAGTGFWYVRRSAPGFTMEWKKAAE